MPERTPPVPERRKSSVVREYEHILPTANVPKAMTPFETPERSAGTEAVVMPEQKALPYSNMPLGARADAYVRQLSFLFSPLGKNVHVSRDPSSGAPRAVLTLALSGGRVTGWKYASVAPDPLLKDMREREGMFMAEDGSGMAEDPLRILRKCMTNLSESLVAFGISRYVSREGVDMLLRSRGMRAQGEGKYAFAGGEVNLEFCPGAGAGMRTMRVAIREWTPEAKSVAESAGFAGEYAGDGMRYQASGCAGKLCRGYAITYRCRDESRRSGKNLPR